MELLKEVVLDCKDLLGYKYGDVKWSGRYAGLTVRNEMKFSYNLRLAESQIIFFSLISMKRNEKWKMPCIRHITKRTKKNLLSMTIHEYNQS